ncbi:MAG TPA: HAMP domain-containing sensor histidine kinase [Draconibacterium sp.]|nr:HAMP domain-containing sensor histidine kinase [Draconibacterium sp.]
MIFFSGILTFMAQTIRKDVHMIENFPMASPERATRNTTRQLENQSHFILQNKQLLSFVESISQMVLILNKHREVIYANKSYTDFCKTLNHDPIIGKRPGETINCINAFRSLNGCGASEQCKTCGAFNAIKESHTGKRATKECQILTIDNDALDLEVTANPLEIGNEQLTVFSVLDISADKRRRSLERVFIHDILNSAGAISGLSSIIKDLRDPEEIRDLAQTIEDASKSLIDEIQSQREFGAAERGELQLSIEEINTEPLLYELQKIYAKHELNNGKPITIGEKSQNFILSTDKVLLKRILGNMIKNAIETNVPNDVITLGCYEKTDGVVLEVHNKSYIPENVSDQIFKRFYSTKGIGRGLGTYSMKLIGEKYLKGKVGVTSSKEEGTTFFIKIPK